MIWWTYPDEIIVFFLLEHGVICDKFELLTLRVSATTCLRFDIKLCMCFTGYLAIFPAPKDFRKSIKIWCYHRWFAGHVFLGYSVWTVRLWVCCCVRSRHWKKTRRSSKVTLTALIRRWRTHWKVKVQEMRLSRHCRQAYRSFSMRLMNTRWLFLCVCVYHLCKTQRFFIVTYLQRRELNC